MTHSTEYNPTSSTSNEKIELDQKVEALIASCDNDAIFGMMEQRAEFAAKVFNLEGELKSSSESPFAFETRKNGLRRGVASRISAMTEDLLSEGAITTDTLDALKALPVPAPALEPEIRKFYESAIEAHKQVVQATSEKERNERLEAAEAVTMVAASFGQDIPAIKDGRRIESSGGAVHARIVLEKDKASKSGSSLQAVSRPAVQSFVQMAYAGELPGKSSVAVKLGRAVATAAATGVIMSAVPMGAAHAAPKIEKIETKSSPHEINSLEKVVLSAAPGPEKDKPVESTPSIPVKDAKLEKVAPVPPLPAAPPKIEAPKSITEDQKTQTDKKSDDIEPAKIKMTLPKEQDKPAKPAEKTDNTPTPSPAASEKSTNTKSKDSKESIAPVDDDKKTNEQPAAPKNTEPTINESPKDQKPPANEPKSEHIKVTLPGANDKSESKDEVKNPTTDPTVDDEPSSKIIDHLKQGEEKQDKIKMKLPTPDQKKSDDDDSEKDAPKTETIGQPNSEPGEKVDLKKEIAKRVMGNGPIKLSLDKVLEETEKRDDKDKKKDGYKSQFKFAPSAELPPPPKPEAPKADTYNRAPIPEHIVDPGMVGETLWSPKDLEHMSKSLDMYMNVEKQTGVEWEIIAALHFREASMGMSNPANGQGIFQLYSSGEYFAPGPISKEEFTRQAVLAANLMKEKAKSGAVKGELSLSNPDKVKDVLFSYNGRAPQYGQQAKALGYNLPAEGSPYVMNLADEKRNSKNNPNWGQILTDNGPLGKANQAPGAWPLIQGLLHIEQKAHDQAVAKQEAEAQAFAAQKAAEAKAAADAEAAKKAQSISNKEIEPFTGWRKPVPESSPVSPQYPGHKGIDFAVKTGTPFYAAAGGVAKVIIYDDVRDDQFCIDAFARIKMPLSAIKDPVQKEVRITTVINGDEYLLIYAHMSQIDIKDGDIVTAGQQIGKTGNSGCSTGDHAHFEVRKNGKVIDPNIVLNGAINVSSSEVKASDDGHSQDDHKHGHSDHEHNSAETVASGVGATGPSDEQKTRLEAIKKVAELKRRMAEKNKISEGYLAIR